MRGGGRGLGEEVRQNLLKENRARGAVEKKLEQVLSTTVNWPNNLFPRTLS